MVKLGCEILQKDFAIPLEKEFPFEKGQKKILQMKSNSFQWPTSCFMLSLMDPQVSVCHKIRSLDSYYFHHIRMIFNWILMFLDYVDFL